MCLRKESRPSSKFSRLKDLFQVRPRSRVLESLYLDQWFSDCGDFAPPPHHLGHLAKSEDLFFGHNSRRGILASGGDKHITVHRTASPSPPTKNDRVPSIHSSLVEKCPFYPVA